VKQENLDLSRMTVEDLFQAKQMRRKRLANLPFEEKIEIVKKLRAVSRSLKPHRDANKAQRVGSPAHIRIKTR
jgi:hypothetical protein